MNLDDDLPRPKAPLLQAPPLERLDVDELQGYVAALRAEIGRVEAEIARKGAVRSAADSVFRF